MMSLAFWKGTGEPEPHGHCHSPNPVKCPLASLPGQSEPGVQAPG